MKELESVLKKIKNYEEIKKKGIAYVYKVVIHPLTKYLYDKTFSYLKDDCGVEFDHTYMLNFSIAVPHISERNDRLQLWLLHPERKFSMSLPACYKGSIVGIMIGDERDNNTLNYFEIMKKEAKVVKLIPKPDELMWMLKDGLSDFILNIYNKRKRLFEY
jgi:hypothetical protein